MNYKETLHWILDKPGRTIHNQDENIRENIAFVHSLGLKCDSVGWSTLELADPRAEEILGEIRRFCRENGWTSRGIYKREYTDPQSQWYMIRGEYCNDSTHAGVRKTLSEDGQAVMVCALRAYHETVAAPKYWGQSLLLPERFRDVYHRNNLEGLVFCWARDVGKYAANQYFLTYGQYLVPEVAVSWRLEKEALTQIHAAGGWLPRLTETIQVLQQIDMPVCYLKKDLPRQGIAYAYIPGSFTCCGMEAILLRRDIAQLLLQEKALPESALMPVPVVEQVPGGYTLRETQVLPRPTEGFMEQMLGEYTQLKKTPRPVRMVTEKDALKALRKAKTARKADFRKKLSNKKAEALQHTRYAPLLPYYCVTDGGGLSDEYTLLSHEAAQEATRQFQERLLGEDLLEEKPEGIVIACCADGDLILLCSDGSLLRFSHEAPEIVGQWPGLEQFLYEAVTEE